MPWRQPEDDRVSRTVWILPGRCTSTQQTRDNDPMAGKCWASVEDVGPTLTHHWVNISVCCSTSYYPAIQRRRRWANNKPTLAQRLVLFAEYKKAGSKNQGKKNQILFYFEKTNHNIYTCGQ